LSLPYWNRLIYLSKADGRLPLSPLPPGSKSPELHGELHTMSLYRSRAGSHFYGTEYEIWADFVPVGNTEKKIGADYEKLLRVFFHVFSGQKTILIVLKNIVVSILKSCIISLL
jgi:hypothetical protein